MSDFRKGEIKSMEKKELIVIGGGPGGYVAAIKASQKGLKVTLIEKAELGGTCLNVGCIPTKALLKSAHLYNATKDSSQFGVDINGANFNLPNAMLWKNRAVKKLTSGVGVLLKKNNVEVIKGSAVLKDNKTVEVNGEIFTFENLIIATGSKPIFLPIPGVNDERVIDSTQALNIRKLPEKIVIIGGGVVAIEFATIFSNVDCHVTVIEMMPEILPSIDSEVAKTLHKLLSKKKIQIITGAKVVEITKKTVVFSKDGQNQEIDSDMILMAAGRKPELVGLELKNTDIIFSPKGIQVNEQMQTNVLGVYAIGDAVPTPQLAHVASKEGIIAIDNITGKQVAMNYTRIPSCVFTEPEIACIGVTENEAKKLGIDYIVGKFPLIASGKATSDGANDGFIKIIVSKEDEEILGVHIMAPHASEMICQASLALTMEATIEEMIEAIYPHPTISESILEATLAARGEAIHF